MAAVDGDTIVVSYDGVDWLQEQTSDGRELWGVTRGEGVYLAVGGDGYLATSICGYTAPMRRLLAAPFAHLEVTFIPSSPQGAPCRLGKSLWTLEFLD